MVELDLLSTSFYKLSNLPPFGSNSMLIDTQAMRTQPGLYHIIQSQRNKLAHLEEQITFLQSTVQLLTQACARQLVTRQLVTRQPVTRQPEMQQPVTRQPEMQQLVTRQPEMQQLVTRQPETRQPEMQQPEMQQLVTRQPEMQQPEMQQLVTQEIQQPEERRSTSEYPPNLVSNFTSNDLVSLFTIPQSESIIPYDFYPIQDSTVLTNTNTNTDTNTDANTDANTDTNTNTNTNTDMDSVLGKRKRDEQLDTTSPTSPIHVYPLVMGAELRCQERIQKMEISEISKKDAKTVKGFNIYWCPHRCRLRHITVSRSGIRKHMQRMHGESAKEASACAEDIRIIAEHRINLHLPIPPPLQTS